MKPVAPLVSVIIPVFNRTIQPVRAVQSVLEQTFSDWELLLVDDGSDMETKRVLLELQRPPRIRVLFSRSNRGVSAARNRGILSARGRLIALLDSDDTWHPQKLQQQLEQLERTPGSVICHTDEEWIRNSVPLHQKKIHAKPEGRIFLPSLPLCAVSPSSILLPRRLLLENGLFDEALPACEDYDMWLRLSSRFEFTLVRRPLVTKYGGHSDQLSRRYWGMDRFRIIALLKAEQLPGLSCAERTALRAMIARKGSILAKGCAKHGRSRQAELYRSLAALYQPR